ncbi:hypothetical protein CCH79_00015109 [Gambusia affinis]|uniref:Uncharacterized protein n=1 Tax=Gambusia affinis TaxID=33528 RepID=A0A315WAS1_GAMAF|nr:hypothetical protein CCH79_00015109 [Gambusia affinis]
MEMTAPVLVKVPEETKLWEPAVYTLNFPLPAAYQDTPPAPTNDKPHTEAAFSHPPSSALMAEDPTAANASVSASAGPSLEPEREAGAWNITTSSSVDTQANPGTEVQPDDAH